LETRAKERLTGAVILVALIVLLVPELLSGPVSRAPTTTGVGSDEPLASYTFGLSDESHGASKAPVTPPRADPPSSAGTAVSAAPATTSASSSAAGLPGATVGTAGSATALSAASSGSSATPSPGVRHGGSASALSAHGARSAAGWWVQLGSFSSRANAERLVRQLKAQGFGASIAEGTGSGHKWYRVRSGPERDHTAAQALVLRLRDSGHGGTIVPAP
jgi:DedD protein